MAIDLAEVTGSAAKIAKEKEKVRNINELDNDAFMRLFLEQLKNQDPTAQKRKKKFAILTSLIMMLLCVSF